MCNLGTDRHIKTLFKQIFSVKVQLKFLIWDRFLSVQFVCVCVCIAFSILLQYTEPHLNILWSVLCIHQLYWICLWEFARTRSWKKSHNLFSNTVFMLGARKQKVGVDWVLPMPGLEYFLEFIFPILHTDH
jgi:hypothetical protein